MFKIKLKFSLNESLIKCVFNRKTIANKSFDFVLGFKYSYNNHWIDSKTKLFTNL